MKQPRCGGCGRFMGWNGYRARWDCVCGVFVTAEELVRRAAAQEAERTARQTEAMERLAAAHERLARRSSSTPTGAKDDAP